MSEGNRTRSQSAADERVSTGIEGLDEILEGGLIPGRGYLIHGGPGTGKTLLGLRFLETGVENGETSLLISLEEPVDDLAQNAASAGIDLAGIESVDLSTKAEAFGTDETYDVFSPEEVEAETVTETIAQALEEHDPDRVFLDPVTLLRHLTPDPYQFRKQVLALVGRIKESGATLLLTSQVTGEASESDLQFVTDGTIDLGWQGQFRRLEVPKFRGSKTITGRHSFRITDEGILVFPDLKPGSREGSMSGEQIPSGIEGIDDLLHGGLERGTATIISGPTGAGKTTLGAQFVKEAASRGERSSIYLFEENKDTFLTRSRAISTPVDAMIEEGTLSLREVEPLERPPEELAQMMRKDVVENGARIVMIDGISGYRLATGGDDDQLLPELHSIVRFLKNQGVTVLLTDETRDLAGSFQATGGHVSYLADNVVFLRHIEIDGELQKVVGVLKKRVSDFGRKLRRMQITSEGIVVGEPLHGMRGVLTGIPEMVDGG